jgi:hypothetical protein
MAAVLLVTTDKARFWCMLILQSVSSHLQRLRDLHLVGFEMQSLLVRLGLLQVQGRDHKPRFTCDQFPNLYLSLMLGAKMTHPAFDHLHPYSLTASAIASLLLNSAVEADIHVGTR